MKDKNQNGNEPWNQTFNDAKDDEGNLSRTKLRKQNKSNSLISIILISAIILIAAIALLFGVMKSTGDGSGGDNASDTATKVQSVSTSKDAKSTDKHKDSAKAKHKTDSQSNKADKADKSSSEAASKQAASSAAESKAASAKSESKAKESSSSSKSDSSSSNGGDYVTVEAGQGIFRVAKNAGISEQELMQLNGLTSASQIHPGQRLRVK
ncbi:LysM peptidoglycan-binding domain-containing protein [Lactobacillaceae bacterium Melli_B4]